MNVRRLISVSCSLFCLLGVVIALTILPASSASASGSLYVGQGGEVANYQAAFNRIGGSSAIGYPESTVHWWGNGCIQDFGGGKYGDSALMQPRCTGTVYVVVGNTWRKFIERFAGGSVSYYGYPYNDGHRWGAGWAQDFSDGTYGWSIFVFGDSVGRAHNVRGDILRYWVNALGGAPGGFGFPVSDEYGWNGLQRQDFQGGSIIWDATSGARVYHAAPPPPPPAPTREQKAVAWAIAEVNSPRPGWSDEYRRIWSGYCEGFVEAAYGNHYGRWAKPYPSALADYLTQYAAGRVHTSGEPPAGALVFYRLSQYGHVALSLGDGRVATTWGFGDAEYPVRIVPRTTFGNYLGWSYANPAWGGR